MDSPERNPFVRLAHEAPVDPGLKHRVMRSARRERALMAIAGLFIGGFIKTLYHTLGGTQKPNTPPSEGKGSETESGTNDNEH